MKNLLILITLLAFAGCSDNAADLKAKLDIEREVLMEMYADPNAPMTGIDGEVFGDKEKYAEIQEQKKRIEELETKIRNH